MLISTTLEGKYYRSNSRNTEGIIQFAERRAVSDKHHSDESTGYAYSVQVRPTYKGEGFPKPDFYSTVYVYVDGEQMSVQPDIIPTNNNNERSKMTLEEFKEYVEMRQKISLEEALARLTGKEN